MKRDCIKISLILITLILLIFMFRPQIAEFLAMLLERILEEGQGGR